MKYFSKKLLFSEQKRWISAFLNINLALDNIKAQIIKHYKRISDREAFVTAEMVRNAYQGIGSDCRQADDKIEDLNSKKHHKSL